MGTTFADRLNRLFATIHPPGRGPFRSAEVITALRLQGFTLSAPYLSQLRSGRRPCPSPAARAALAGFFGVKPEYFTNEQYYARVDLEQRVWLSLTRDDDVRRLALDVAALPPSDRGKVRALVDHLHSGQTPPSEFIAAQAS